MGSKPMIPFPRMTAKDEHTARTNRDLVNSETAALVKSIVGRKAHRNGAFYIYRRLSVNWEEALDASHLCILILAIRHIGRAIKATQDIDGLNTLDLVDEQIQNSVIRYHFLICRTLACDTLRIFIRHHRNTISRPAEEIDLILASPKDASPQDAALAREFRVAFRSAFRRLPKRSKQVVRLRMRDADLTWEAISHLLKVPTRTLQAAYRKDLTQLRCELEEYATVEDVAGFLSQLQLLSKPLLKTNRK